MKIAKLFLAGILATLTYHAAHAGEGMLSSMLPECINEYGDKVDVLFYTLVYTTFIAFGLVLTILLVLCVAYRSGNGKKALYTHGDSWKATALTGTMAALVFLSIDMNTVRLSKEASKVLENPPDFSKATQVKVLGKQFSWHFLYPGKDGKFGTFNVRKGDKENWFGAVEGDALGKDDIEVEGTLVVPVGKPVVCEIRARDVIHSFFIPVTRIKQDAVPGLVAKMWFVPRKKGTYPIVCAELCGFMHSQMSGVMKVVDEDEYNKWLQEKAEDKQ